MSKVNVGDIVRVTIEGEVGYVALDGEGFDFKRGPNQPNSVRLNKTGVSVEVIQPAKPKAEEQFAALPVGAAFKILSGSVRDYGPFEGIRLKTSETTYFNVDQRIQYTVGKGGGSTLSNEPTAYIEEVYP